jgi:hypothetical protein
MSSVAAGVLQAANARPIKVVKVSGMNMFMIGLNEWQM